jgi:hypothetical protein
VCALATGVLQAFACQLCHNLQQLRHHALPRAIPVVISSSSTRFALAESWLGVDLRRERFDEKSQQRPQDVELAAEAGHITVAEGYVETSAYPPPPVMLWG